MTANTPPIAAWAPSTALHKLESRHNNAPCVLTDGPAEFNDVALVRLDDYEALQAELEQWKNGSTIRDEQNEELHQYVLELKTEIEKLRTALAESRANDQQAMAYLNEVRAIVGGDNFPDMVRRCERLQAECEKLRTAAEVSAADANNAERGLETVKAECEKLRKDAERYRWLADACVSDWLGEEGPVLVHAKPWNANWRAELDAAIDAAMQGDKP